MMRATGSFFLFHVCKKRNVPMAHQSSGHNSNSQAIGESQNIPKVLCTEAHLYLHPARREGRDIEEQAVGKKDEHHCDPENSCEQEPAPS